MTQISQSAACNRFHSIESRLARWLLMTQDRMRSDDFRITQDFLSNMLGVRREAVNKAASALQNLELISYNRGQLSILNRNILASKACLCYPIISRQPAL
jgi:CRP-like cAMP-binding protein